MSTSTTLALSATLAAAKSTINTLIVSQGKAAEKFAISSREHTYAVAGHLVVLGRTLLAEDNEAEFADLCVKNKITVRRTANPWSYVIALAMPGDKTWANRGPALRALHNHSNKDLTSEKLAKFVDLFELKSIYTKTQDDALMAAVKGSTAKRLDGLMKLDALQHRDPTAPSDEKLIEKATAAEALNLNDKLVTDTAVKFVMVWARVEDGKVIPMGVVEKSEGQAKSAAVQAGKAIHATPLSTEVEEVIADKLGDIITGDEIVTTDAPEFVIDQSASAKDVA